MFRCERETTLFGIQKRTRLEISGSVIFTTLFQNRTQILECVQRYILCPEPRGVAYNVKTVSIKWSGSSF